MFQLFKKIEILSQVLFSCLKFQSHQRYIHMTHRISTVYLTIPLIRFSFLHKTLLSGTAESSNSIKISFLLI